MEEVLRKANLRMLFIIMLLVIVMSGCQNKREEQNVQDTQVLYESQDTSVLEYEDVDKENDDICEKYLGKWKVIQYIPLNTSTVELSYWKMEHYLGRTVEISDNTVKRSIYYWPNELDEYVVEYDYCEENDMQEESIWITQNAESLRWLDGDYFQNGIIRILLFYQEGAKYEETYCAVTSDKNHLIVSWLSGKYLLERYDEQKKDLVLEDIYGYWEITRLDCYDNVYEGHVKDAELVEEYGKKSLNLSEFYAPDWFGKGINITSEYLEIDPEIKNQIINIQSQIVDKELFEEEQGIHDGLSLNNEELLIYEIYYGEEKEVLTVVPVNENKIIVHLGMGWFILEKGILH